MVELIWDDSFIRTFKKWKKKHPNLISPLRIRLTQFAQDPFHPSLKTHSLSGVLNGCWAMSVSYEHRLVFKFISDAKVLLVDIGSHDEVY